MNFLDTIPAFIRVLFAFVLILLAIKRKVSLGNSFLVGAVFMGLLFGLKPLALLHSMAGSLMHPKTLSLGAIVCLILVLSHSMELSGQMQRLVDRFEGLVTRPWLNLIVFPALIGLLPMPGGAIFSAPMVKTAGNRLPLSLAQMSYANYWFRHIWEYWWPLYPGVLLTTALAGLDLWTFVIFLFPLTFIAIFVGYWPLQFRDAGGTTNHGSIRPPVGPFLRELIPILIAIGFGLALGSILDVFLKSHGIDFAKEIGLILALMTAILYVWRANRMPASERLEILKRKQLIDLFYMVAAILIFKGILEDSQAVKAISGELLHWHIPLVPITIILPFFVGWVMGITIAFVGTTFPILISLVHSLGEGQYLLAYMMLALGSGFVGVLLSPLHICMLLSNQYFGTSPGPVYGYLWKPCAALLMGCYGYFAVLHVFAGV